MKWPNQQTVYWIYFLNMRIVGSELYKKRKYCTWVPLLNVQLLIKECDYTWLFIGSSFRKIIFLCLQVSQFPHFLIKDVFGGKNHKKTKKTNHSWRIPLVCSKQQRTCCCIFAIFLTLINLCFQSVGKKINYIISKHTQAFILKVRCPYLSKSFCLHQHNVTDLIWMSFSVHTNWSTDLF